ncbi:Hypothetical protein OINT_1001372 [Brucella intermedia LMG 3301]|uniref:Uncharacterized protein n=1 Tax=Brucella intermedia LMG 3301 TaxID=641118 RepID=C4WKD7_9HYPH|nr:Hypothetical protein OINT_1001372 [Brucella intermedia LMG 3301]
MAASQFWNNRTNGKNSGSQDPDSRMKIRLSCPRLQADHHLRVVFLKRKACMRRGITLFRTNVHARFEP